jgi:hypothetical protein
MNERLFSLKEHSQYEWAENTDVEVQYSGTLTPNIVIFLRKYQTDDEGSILSAPFTPSEARELAHVLTEFAKIADMASGLVESGLLGSDE